MTTWFTTASRVAVNWDTDLTDRVAQTDLYQIDRRDDGSEITFLFARSGATVSAHRLAWALTVESNDPVPDPITPGDPAAGAHPSDVDVIAVRTDAEYAAIETPSPRTLYITTG